MKLRHKQCAFTLIELMVVVAIIGILASVALPAYNDYIVRAKISEGLSIADGFKGDVKAFYREYLVFPKNNEQLDIPAEDMLIGNYVKRVALEEGAFHIVFGFKVGPALEDKILTLRPAVVEGSPTSPISWLCGYDQAVPGMKAVGANKTDIDAKLLPSPCRKPAL